MKIRNHLGFGFENEKQQVIIPFTSYNNLIIIKAQIDGKNCLNLILDTGIRSLVLFERSFLPELGSNTFRIKFSGAGAQKPLEAEVSTNHNLRLCDDVVANQINAVILNQSNKYLHKINNIKIHGAFGYQLFARFQVRIDYQNQLITLTEPIDIDNIPGFEAIPLSIHDTKPFLTSDYLVRKNRWKRMNLMLDLGANHQMLFHEGFVKPGNFSYSREKVKIAEGLSGPIFGIKDHCMVIKVGSETYFDVEILIPTDDSYRKEQIPGINKQGSLGGKFFETCVIIVDYINGYLFIRQKDKNKPKNAYMVNSILKE